MSITNCPSTQLKLIHDWKKEKEKEKEKRRRQHIMIRRS